MAKCNAYIANLNQEIESLKQQLKPLEGGALNIREQRFSEPWRDATEEHIEMLKRALAKMRAVVERGSAP